MEAMTGVGQKKRQKVAKTVEKGASRTASGHGDQFLRAGSNDDKGLRPRNYQGRMCNALLYRVTSFGDHNQSGSCAFLV